MMTGGNALLDAKLILSRAAIKEGMVVADLGCGASGHFVFPSAKIVGKKGIVYAVDILKTILQTIDKRAKLENLQNVRTVWSDLEIFGATKIEAGSLDTAYLINTLYQSKKRMEIIREAARLLKKSGKLIVVEWKSTASPFGPSVDDRVDKELLMKGSAKLGFNIEDEFEAGEYHYGAIFIKA
ncbi:MAG: methyltransferase domain-containing protein [Patescibacteria group bacterium]|jgi:ubiquinone/menaquinone biosynthesis C-methylase UbiE